MPLSRTATRHARRQPFYLVLWVCTFSVCLLQTLPREKLHIYPKQKKTRPAKWLSTKMYFFLTFSWSCSLFTEIFVGNFFSALRNWLQFTGKWAPFLRQTELHWSLFWAYLNLTFNPWKNWSFSTGIIFLKSLPLASPSYQCIKFIADHLICFSAHKKPCDKDIYKMHATMTHDVLKQPSYVVKCFH